jgi:uncharacterized protein YjbI with pentapeptide repeats
MVMLHSYAGSRYDASMFQPGEAPSKPVSANRLAALLSRFEVVMDLNMPGLELNGFEIADRSFYGCNFTKSVFRECIIRNCTFELCFFDFSSHSDATYTGLNAKNCVFACSAFEQISFTGSNLIQCNFNSITGTTLVIDDCDLLHSRFDGVRDIDLRMTNCNMKETRFIRTPRDRVTFSYANEEDAVFVDKEGW